MKKRNSAELVSLCGKVLHEPRNVQKTDGSKVNQVILTVKCGKQNAHILLEIPDWQNVKAITGYPKVYLEGTMKAKEIIPKDAIIPLDGDVFLVPALEVSYWTRKGKYYRRRNDPKVVRFLTIDPDELGFEKN